MKRYEKVCFCLISSFSVRFRRSFGDSVGRSAIPSVLCAIPSVVLRFSQSFERFRRSSVRFRRSAARLRFVCGWFVGGLRLVCVSRSGSVVSRRGCVVSRRGSVVSRSGFVAPTSSQRRPPRFAEYREISNIPAQSFWAIGFQTTSGGSLQVQTRFIKTFGDFLNRDVGFFPSLVLCFCVRVSQSPCRTSADLRGT